ncbi:MAG: DUF4145 domain-containing protein [Dehalogenimonas sp.]|uniref:DUF4145 domain-containing protein n=1 Tax=Candidatus Dehalogenimonas loeffleri TaxID=3127115 RepID=A0ABZ2J5T5_9CHLR|nr:DUF4145 domain-containing protein [Dehalogenimonas sp.]
MAQLVCPECYGKKSSNQINIECKTNVELHGIIRCLECQHEIPITMHKGFIQSLDLALPGTQSKFLNSSVPADIKEDIEEAERANYSQCYKACVAMCRRALQLSLIDKGIEDKPLGKMLEEATSSGLLGAKIYALATSIKGYGDIGVHRREKIDPEEARLVIYTTVRMLNELFIS